MKLNQCTTVRDSLNWMDQIVSGFWDFATKNPSHGNHSAESQKGSINGGMNL